MGSWAAGDFDIPIAGELRVHEDHGVTGVVESLVEAGGEAVGPSVRRGQAIEAEGLASWCWFVTVGWLWGAKPGAGASLLVTAGVGEAALKGWAF